MAFLITGAGDARGQLQSSEPGSPLPGLSYTNCRIAKVPWSVHVVQLERSNALYEIHSVHAGGRSAIGLQTLSDQVSLMDGRAGYPIAAVNADFYQRDKAYAGAPRGLQVTEGEVISAPLGGVTFWLDARGEPHLTNLVSLFQITWPDGSETSFGLNGERHTDGVELYTSAVGPSTLTVGGRELILELAEGSPRLPLRVGRTYTGRVREIHEGGNTPLAPDIIVVSLGPTASQRLPSVQIGTVLRISTRSVPALHGIRTAISGGPVLVRNGKRQKMPTPSSEDYEFSSTLERHPRSALGWNANFLYLVVVDGRQKDLSVGMTLDELSRFMLDLGCKEAMNFDGGGSATLWFNGQIRNSPCDRAEREISNCLIVSRKRPDTGRQGSLNRR